MASFEPFDRFDPIEPPPRPTTPPVRRGFILALLLLCLAATLVYGVPYMAERAGFAWEAGRSKAAIEALEKLDKAGVIDRSSAIFRMATTAAAPAVVNIRNWKAGRLPQGVMPPMGGGGRFERGLVPVGSGSGVIIDKARGLIVTNNHVVNGADELVVRLGQGGEWPAKLVGADPKTDLAVLRVSAPLDAEAAWGDSDKIDIGDWVLAIGSPFELDRTVTAGIVSATGRSNLRIIGEGSYEDFIQTDAAVNPGNSGGPLIDLRGHVVGIITAIYSPAGGGPNENQGNVGIGFAIPSNLARKIADDLIKSGHVVRGYLGVVFGNAGGDRGRNARIPGGKGLVVEDIDPDGPAAKAGVKAEDVIVKLGNADVADGVAFRNRTASLPVGSKQPLTFYRDGKPRTVSVTIAEFPRLAALGLHVRNLSGPAARLLPGSPDEAVIVHRVIPGSSASMVGLIPGTQILSINRRSVSSKADCDAVAETLDPAGPVSMEVLTPEGQPAIVVLNPGVRVRRP